MFPECCTAQGVEKCGSEPPLNRARSFYELGMVLCVFAGVQLDGFTFKGASSPSEHSVNIPSTFRQHSVNIPSTFRQHSVNIQSTFRQGASPARGETVNGSKHNLELGVSLASRAISSNLKLRITRSVSYFTPIGCKIIVFQLYFKRNHRCPAGLPFLDDWLIQNETNI
jgi:hypothetical protein